MQASEDAILAVSRNDDHLLGTSCTSLIYSVSEETVQTEASKIHSGINLSLIGVFLLTRPLMIKNGDTEFAFVACSSACFTIERRPASEAHIRSKPLYHTLIYP